MLIVYVCRVWIYPSHVCNMCSAATSSWLSLITIPLHGTCCSQKRYKQWNGLLDTDRWFLHSLVRGGGYFIENLTLALSPLKSVLVQTSIFCFKLQCDC